MEYREIGKSGIEASSIALGTWAVGGGPWWGDSDDKESIKAIHAAVDAGVTMIDTAPAYGFGHSEEVVGRALKGRRDKVVLCTKCGLWWKDDRGSFKFEQLGKRVHTCLRPETIAVEIDASLGRLDTDYIDLYMTHWQAVEPDKTPIEDTMASLLKMKDEGKIRCIGVSNADVSHMKEYLASGRIDSNQLKYSMLDRKIENKQVPFCIENGISIQAYSPLEQGLLTGRIGMDYRPSDTEYRNLIPYFKPENRSKVLNMLGKWKPLTEKYGCSTAQLVIAWTVCRPGITFMLCGARKTAHVIDNVQAAGIKLEIEDTVRMTRDVESLGVAV
jgi:methylglyoxal reductase